MATVRKRSKVSTELPRPLREAVDRMLIEGETYEQISAYLADQGHEIGKSSIGRYGKDFLETCRRVRIVTDQAKQIVSGPDEGLILEESGAKLLLSRILEMITFGEVEPDKIAALSSAVARLQSAGVQREKLKDELARRMKEAAERAESEIDKSAAKGEMTPERLKQIVRESYGV